MFAVLDDVIENITGWENRVNISDNGFILLIVQTEFAIVLLADVCYFFEFSSDLNVLCMTNHGWIYHEKQEEGKFFHKDMVL